MTSPSPGHARSLAVQSTTELGGPLSVLSRQRADHVQLDRLLRELAATSPRDQQPVLQRIYRLVFPHAFAEETVLWPVMRRRLPDGEALTLQVEREHQEVNELVNRLDGLPADHPERDPLLDRLATVLREDVRDEEDQLLPRLQQVLAPAQLRRLGLAWELVRRLAPTRAHPVIARRPPGNVLAALPLSVIDRARDVVHAGAHRGGARWGGRLAMVDQSLRRAAGRVEQLRMMRAGDDPSTARAPH